MRNLLLIGIALFSACSLPMVAASTEEASAIEAGDSGVFKILGTYCKDVDDATLVVTSYPNGQCHVLLDTSYCHGSYNNCSCVGTATQTYGQCDDIPTLGPWY